MRGPGIRHDATELGSHLQHRQRASHRRGAAPRLSPPAPSLIPLPAAASDDGPTAAAATVLRAPLHASADAVLRGLPLLARRERPSPSSRRPPRRARPGRRARRSILRAAQSPNHVTSPPTKKPDPAPRPTASKPKPHPTPSTRRARPVRPGRRAGGSSGSGQLPWWWWLVPHGRRRRLPTVPTVPHRADRCRRFPGSRSRSTRATPAPGPTAARATTTPVSGTSAGTEPRATGKPQRTRSRQKGHSTCIDGQSPEFSR